MKDKIIIGLLAVSIIFNIINFSLSSRTGASESTNKEVPKQGTAPNEVIKAPETIEVGDVMTKLQRHMNKLWFASKNENWPLMNFYVHELDESEDIIVDNNVVDEGINLSQLIKIMGKAPLKELQSAENAQDPVKFKEQYLNVIKNCNACHVSAKKEFIVIKEPTVPAYDNQEYKKQ